MYVSNALVIKRNDTFSGLATLSKVFASLSEKSAGADSEGIKGEGASVEPPLAQDFIFIVHFA